MSRTLRILLFIIKSYYFKDL